MAKDLQTLVVSLSADIKRYENALNKAQGITNRNAKRIESRFVKMNSNLASSFGGLGTKLAGVFAGGALVKGAVRFSEAATRIDNSLKVAGLSGEKLEQVYSSLRDSAVKNAAPLESLVELYSRASLVQKELGVTSEQLVGFTDKIAVALRVSGKTAQESSGALLQLSQALGSGVVRAEEFNSIQEGAPTILQAAARGIKEAAGSVSALRKIMLDGGLSSKALFDGFVAGSDLLTQRASTMQITFGQAMENLQTALIDTAREFNTATGASAKFATGINDIAAAISGFDISGFIAKIQEAGGAFETFLNTIGNANVFEDLNKALGYTDGEGRMINLETKQAEDKAIALEREVKDLQSVIANNTKLGIDTTEALARLVGVQAAIDSIKGAMSSLPKTYPNGQLGDTQPIQMRPTLGTKDDAVAAGPISLKDPKYAVPAKEKKAKKAKSAPRTAESRFNDDIQAIKDRTAALAEETALVGKSYLAQEQRKMALDLEQSALADLREEARKKGQTDLDSIKLAPEQVAQINAVSAAYAIQADELRKVQETQDKAEQAAGEFYDTFKGGVIDAITGAESLSDALSGVLKKLGDMLLNAAFDALFQPASGSSSGGAFGGIFGSIGKVLGFAKGTNNAPGGLSVVGEKGPELMNVPKGAQIIPNHKLRAPSMPSLKAGGVSGGAGTFTYAPVIDNRGASAEAVSRLEVALAKDRASFEANTIKAIRKANKTNTKLK